MSKPDEKTTPMALQFAINRRTILVASLSAVSGLFSGVATAWATRRPPTATGQALLQPLLHFSGHEHSVRAVSWSPDGKMLASGADDGTLLLWTLGGQIQQRIAHPTAVTVLAWSPTNQHLVSGSDKSLRFFDAKSALLLAPARTAHTAPITSLAWSGAAGHLVVSGSLDTRAIVWETQQFWPQAVFLGHTAPINALSCLPNSAIIASASQGGLVRVWQAGTLQELHGAYQDGQVPLHGVSFAGNQLAVCRHDGQVSVWNNGLTCSHMVGKQCTDAPLRFQAHTAPVRAIAWSPDASLLATGGDDGVVSVWGKNGLRRAQASLSHPVLSICWEPTGRAMATASGNTITIWTVST